ncbi:M81 family metallopeptidase [Bordetella sp. 2513F-2]
MKTRILCGAIYHEAHSFNPIVTGRSSFDITFGDDALDKNRGTNTITGGIIDAAEELNLAVTVPASFRTLPAGPVDHRVFLEFQDCMLEAARSGDFDAIVLSLHGAMMTTECSDPEAELMRNLRKIVGPSMPLTAGMDLHAHVTPETLAPCDFITAFKTNPHSDMALTGRRALHAAKGMLDGTFMPVCASVHIPMLTLGRDRTDEQPLLGLHELAASYVKDGGLWDMSIFNVQQFLDIAGMGQTILAYSNGDPDKAREAADDIARRLWDLRAETIGSYPGIEEVLTIASQAGRTRPVIIGDQGDRVAAGGPGDSTYILRALKDDFNSLPAALPIRDLEAVRACMRHRPGDPVTVVVGGKHSVETAPVQLCGTLLEWGENRTITLKGPAHAGVQVSTGAYAVVQEGPVSVILTEKPLNFMDPNFYTGFGVNPGDVRVLVARSGYHYTLNYADTGDCFTTDTPGMTAYHPEQQPFTVARPFWPVDDIPYRPRTTLTVRRS